MFESRVFVAALEISESKETNLGESKCQGVKIPHCGEFRTYNEKGTILQVFRVSDMFVLVTNKEYTCPRVPCKNFSRSLKTGEDVAKGPSQCEWEDRSKNRTDTGRV